MERCQQIPLVWCWGGSEGGWEEQQFRASFCLRALKLLFLFKSWYYIDIFF